MKIAKTELLNYLIVIVFFYPFAESGVISFLENMLAAVVCCILLRYYKRVFSKESIALSVYLGIRIIIYVISPYWDIHTIVSQLKLIVFLLYFGEELKYRLIQMLRPLTYVLGVYAIMNIIETLSNDTVSELFGGKNTKCLWLFPTVFIIEIFSLYYSKKKFLRLMPVCFSILTIIVAIRVDSSTSLAVAVIQFAFVCLYMFDLKLNIEMKYVTIGYYIFSVCLLAGSIGFISELVTAWLHRDMTFTGRTLIWSNVIRFFSKRPLLGYGNVAGEVAASMLGHRSFTSAHNQLLQTLFEGGLVLFGFIVILMIAMVKSADSLTVPKMKLLVSGMYIVLLIEGTFENAWFSPKVMSLSILFILVSKYIEKQMKLDSV